MNIYQWRLVDLHTCLLFLLPLSDTHVVSLSLSLSRASIRNSFRLLLGGNFIKLKINLKIVRTDRHHRHHSLKCLIIILEENSQCCKSKAGSLSIESNFPHLLHQQFIQTIVSPAANHIQFWDNIGHYFNPLNSPVLIEAAKGSNEMVKTSCDLA
ncbi:hypothetical protein L1987_23214 [Smallanthus sonchifolius]|uniref:Uncharacterized protein n=1 Tax=Smallanthus sonchifolius TaxID=185202 RepID=A0ACB9IID7_9ASTR|nr:hypothetical protein L1987_23214 [Smallanthus sonchifolius]